MLRIFFLKFRRFFCLFSRLLLCLWWLQLTKRQKQSILTRKCENLKKLAKSTTFILNFQPLLLTTSKILKWFLIEQNQEIILSTKISKLVGVIHNPARKTEQVTTWPRKKNVLESFFLIFFSWILGFRACSQT